MALFDCIPFKWFQTPAPRYGVPDPVFVSPMVRVNGQEMEAPRDGNYKFPLCLIPDIPLAYSGSFLRIGNLAIDLCPIIASCAGLVQGPAGLSAYQIAVANGFVGTEAAWLASLGGGGNARNVVTTVNSVDGMLTLDYALGDYFSCALLEDISDIFFVNLPTTGHAADLKVLFIQNFTITTVSWPASFIWEGGVASGVSLPPGARDVLTLTNYEGLFTGSNWFATLRKAWA